MIPSCKTKSCNKYEQLKQKGYFPDYAFIRDTDFPRPVKKYLGVLVDNQKFLRKYNNNIGISFFEKHMNYKKTSIYFAKNYLNEKNMIDGWAILNEEVLQHYATKQQQEKHQKNLFSCFDNNGKLEEKNILFYAKLSEKRNNFSEKRKQNRPQTTEYKHLDNSIDNLINNKIKEKSKISDKNLETIQEIFKNNKSFEILFRQLSMMMGVLSKIFFCIMPLPKKLSIKAECIKEIRVSYAKFSKNIFDYVVCIAYVISNSRYWNNGQGYNLGLLGLSWIVRDYLDEAREWLEYNGFTQDGFIKNYIRFARNKLSLNNTLLKRMRPLERNTKEYCDSKKHIRQEKYEKKKKKLQELRKRELQNPQKLQDVLHDLLSQQKNY